MSKIALNRRFYNHYIQESYKIYFNKSLFLFLYSKVNSPIFVSSKGNNGEKKKNPELLKVLKKMRDTKLK